MSKPDDADWDAIELDFRAGVLPLTAIAKKFDVSVSRIKAQAQKFMWERKPMNPFDLQKAHGVASTAPSGAKFGMDSVLVHADLDKAAILTAATVIDLHRKDVKSLREMGGKFAQALAGLFSVIENPIGAHNPEEALEAMKHKLATLGILIGDKTPADLLEQLSRVMVRLVTIERQAYGLDVMPNPDPNADANTEQVQSEVNKLWTQIQDMQKEKTALH